MSRSLTLQVVARLIETPSRRHIGVVGEEFAVSKDGMEMFGVINLETSFDGSRFAIRIRNANNKRFRLSCTVGLRVFMCHNLAFQGQRARSIGPVGKTGLPSRLLRSKTSEQTALIADRSGC